MTRAKPIPKAETLERERQALELRRAGWTFDVIAARLGYTGKGAAHKAVDRALKRAAAATAYNADAIRDAELDRLDRLQTVWWPQAMKADPAGLAAVMRIMERRAKMLALDIVPTATARTDTDGNLVVHFGIPRPDPVACDAEAVPQTALTEEAL
jgi:nitrogen fixation/metabolism regulation signal transduction histidine kinase